MRAKHAAGFGRLRSGASQAVLVFVLGGVSFALFERGRGLLGGNPELFVGPRAEVKQLAALGAERAVRVVSPGDRSVTGRALHKDSKWSIVNRE
jgi:hypothetical protein